MCVRIAIILFFLRRPVGVELLLPPLLPACLFPVPSVHGIPISHLSRTVATCVYGATSTSATQVVKWE
jgi:hypothetical protein